MSARRAGGPSRWETEEASRSVRRTLARHRCFEIVCLVFFCRICLLAVKIESITVGDNGPIDCRRTARTAHTQTHTHSRRLDNKELANSKKLVSPKKGRATHRLQQRIDTDVVIFNPRDYTDQGWALKGLNLTPQPPPQPLYQEKKPRHSERVWGCGCVNEIEEDPSRPTIPLQQWPRQHVKEDPRKDSTNRKKEGHQRRCSQPNP